jgi:AcrR family transcriptional regulator
MVSWTFVQYPRLVSIAGRTDQERDRQQRILDAVLSLLSQRGIAGVSMRTVAKEAGVSLGLLHYYYEDKVGLIRAALLRIEEDDISLLGPDPGLPPEERLRAALRRVVSPEFLTTDYLALRLQLWSLAQAHEDFAEINTTAQHRYRERLADLIKDARPHLPRRECKRRAVDIDVIQNGLWLTALLGLDKPSLNRCVARCEDIAFGDP